MGLCKNFACSMPGFDRYYFYMASVYLAIRGSCMVYWSVLVFNQTVRYDRYASWKGDVQSALIALIVISGVHIALALCIGGFAILYFGNVNFRKQCTSASNTTVVFAFMFLAALIGQSVAAIYILVETPNARDDFRDAFNNYGFKWEDTQFVDDVQRTLTCCGIYSYSDYYDIHRPIPQSCCFIGACTEDRARTRSGCLYALRYYGFSYGYRIEYRTYAIGVFTLSISAFEFIAYIFALCLANSIKKRNASGQGIVHNNFPVYSTQNIPTYMTQNIPTYMTQNIPTHMTQNIPTHMTQNIPTHMTQNIPTHMTQNIPTHMTQNIPTYMTQNIPTHMTQSIPTHMTQNIPTHIAKIPDTQKYE